MITEIVLLNFIFWEILCHTGYPTESLRFSQRKIDVDSPFCLLRGNVRVKKNPPSYELLSLNFDVEISSFRCSSKILNELGKITKDFEKKQLSNFVISHTVISLHFERHKIFFKLRIYRFVEFL